MIKHHIAVLILLVLTGPSIQGQNFYVSESGSDSGPGTLDEPFGSIQHAVNQLGPGDTLFIRGGSYHEEITINNRSGSPGAEIVITNFGGEEVILDGTIPIETLWEVHQDAIYKTTIDENIWQLFVDGRMQVVARWPNTSTHPVDPISRVPGSRDVVHGTWWSRATTWASADGPSTLNGLLEDNPGIHDLGATGQSFEGGSVLLSVLEQGGDGNQERLITHHEAGSNTLTHPVLFPPKPDLAYRNNGKFYIIEHLNALDQSEEWYFVDSSNTIYLWAKEGMDPGTLQVRGRNHSRAFTLSNADYIRIRGFHFFASNISVLGDHVTVEDCQFYYPDASKRLVGIYPNTSTDASITLGNYIDGEWFSLINCEFRYTEYNVLKVVNGTGSYIENNLFYHLSMLGLGKNGAIEQVNTYTHNSMVTSGSRGAVKTNAGPLSGRNHTHNLFDGFGYMQVPDGASLQAAPNNTPGTNRSHNWFLNANKFGSRWDGKPAGNGGLNHHNVGVQMRATLQVKGNEHHSYNNSSFDSQPYNDIILLSDPVYGGNGGSFTFNNLADRMSGHRSENISSYPLPGTHGHNWNGYEQQSDANLQVRDLVNRDFRPRPGSDLVDAGQEIPGITDGFKGNSPDIGAYEYGDTCYWIPGRRMAHASNPVPTDKGTTQYNFVDLMWLESNESLSSDVYFGATKSAVESATHGSVEFMGNQYNNIFHPGALQAGQTYFWRIDAVNENKTVKGQVWSFTAGVDGNPNVYEAAFQVLGMKNGEVALLVGAEIRMGGRSTKTNESGMATIPMLLQGMYYYDIFRKGYLMRSDSVQIAFDTTISDTLEYTTYNVSFLLEDVNGGEAIEGGEILFDGMTLHTDNLGNVKVYEVEYNWYEVSASAAGFNGLMNQMLEIYSDTTFVLLLGKEDNRVDIRVVNRVSELPVNRAKISFDDQLVLTNAQGHASLEHSISGTLIFSIEHDDFFTITDSAVIMGDTSLVVEMTSKLASIQFVISDVSGALPGAIVVFNKFLTLNSDTEGKVKFINQPARENYDYTVSKEGYEILSDSLYLEHDTTISATLEPLTGIVKSNTTGIEIYPNPARNELLIHIPFHTARLNLINADGKVIMEKKIFKGDNILDLCSFPEGVYIIQIQAKAYNGWNKLVIQ